MKIGKRIAEGFHRAVDAVRYVLKTAHSKKEMIDLRREKLEKLTSGKDIKPAAENDCTPPAENDSTLRGKDIKPAAENDCTPPAENDSTLPIEKDSTLPTEKDDQEEA